MPARRMLLLVVILILVAGLLPPGIYWYLLGRVPGISPDEARRRVESAQSVLVDVRTIEEFSAGHLDGAVNWPLGDVRAAQVVPPALQNKELLLICTSGWRSASATRILSNQSIPRVYSVRGGLQAWGIDAPRACPAAFVMASSGNTPSTRPVASFRPASSVEQWAAVLTGFVVKPFYMATALALAFVLRSRRSPDLVALRWAMIFFFLGELFCALNYLAYGERSILFEYLHNFGMVLTFAITSFAVFEGVDRRIVRFTADEQKCALLGLCQRCIKNSDAPCGLRRVFLLIIPATVMLAAIPLCAPIRPTVYTTEIFGAPYTYIHETVHQVYEIRFLPLLAIALLSASFLILWIKERHPIRYSRVLFVAALGALSFSIFRLVLLQPFSDNQVWFATWEEITELLYVVAVAAGLWIFRHALFQPQRSGIPKNCAPVIVPADHPADVSGEP
jgi:rhodanese-related sulfurtransferase